MSMPVPRDPINLTGWRRAVAELYARVRHDSIDDPRSAWQDFCAGRDRLFRYHPSTPLTSDQQLNFTGLEYFPYDLAWRVTGEIIRDIPQDNLSLELPTEGLLRLTRVAQVRFRIEDQEASLNIFWLHGYGGGLFLPFKDPTNGVETYRGGRYLYDTIKGADLGMHADRIVLDFNFAYNPSCAYNDLWVCPLLPTENLLPLPVRAGEKSYLHG